MNDDKDENCSIYLEILEKEPQPTVVYPCCGHTCHLACVLRYMWVVENTYSGHTRQFGLAAQCGSCGSKVDYCFLVIMGVLVNRKNYCGI